MSRNQTNANAEGVIRVLGKEDKPYYTSEDIQELMGVSRSKAYNMIKALRQELIDEGKMAPVYPAGKVPKKYFNERCWCS